MDRPRIIDTLGDPDGLVLGCGDCMAEGTSVTSEAILIERSAHLRALASAIEKADQYLGGNELEFRRLANNADSLIEKHEAEGKGDEILQLRNDLEYAFEAVEHDAEALATELRSCQAALRNIE